MEPNIDVAGAGTDRAADRRLESVVTGIPATLAELHPDSWTDPFWEAATLGELIVPRCTSCGTFRMPPGPFCWSCRSQDVEWVRSLGNGTVYSFTVVRHAVLADLADAVPYAVAVIELDDAPGMRLIGALVDVDVDGVSIGDRVRVVWEVFAADVVIPRFASA